jgi:hypothetical protein
MTSTPEAVSGPRLVAAIDALQDIRTELMFRFVILSTRRKDDFGAP